MDNLTTPQPAAAPGSPFVTGAPRRWLRVEGLAGLLAGLGGYLALGGDPLWLVPALLAVDLSMAGYLAGPRTGSVVYNAAHTWLPGTALLAAGWALAAPPLLLAGAVLVAHVGMDRLAGYGLKYPTGFADTHLGRLGR